MRVDKIAKMLIGVETLSCKLNVNMGYYSGNKTIGEKRQSGRIRARGCASWEVPAPIL